MPDAAQSTFKLKLNGKEYDTSKLPYIKAIEYVESLDELDAMTVQIKVPETDPDAVLKLAKHGDPYELQIGSGDDMAIAVQGDIIEISQIRGVNQSWTMVLRGLDKLHRLRSKTRSKVWEGSHSDIASKIASENGLSGDAQGVEGTATYTFQANVTDAVFLLRLAKENNYFIRVQDGKLKFARRNQSYNDTVNLKWGEDIKDIEFHTSLHNLVTKVKVKGWDYKQDAAIDGEADTGKLQKISSSKVGASLAKTAFGDIELLIDNADYANTSAAKARAKAEIQARAENFLQGQVVCTGNSKAASGGKVKIEGTGPMDGTYLIRQTRHILEPGVGYRTVIDFISDSLPQ